MSLIRFFGGVPKADHDALDREVQALSSEVTRLKRLVEGPGSDQALLREAVNAAKSAKQDANSAANSAAVATQAATTAAAAFDSLNEALANHALALAALERRVAALEGGTVVEPEPEPEPPVGQPDLTLRATKSPTLSGDAAKLAAAARWYAQNGEEHFDKPTSWLFSQPNVYDLARLGRNRLSNVTQAFRVTKDLHLLDAAAQWLAATRANLAVGYRGASVSWPASPYRCWVALNGFESEPLYYGTDLSVMNEVKWHATLSEVAYALHLNRDQTSPAGLDYGREADTWKAYLTDEFTPKWSGGGTDGWRREYRGVRRTPTFSASKAGPENGYGPQRFGRPAEGQWPLIVNGGEYHSSVSAILLAHFMHLLTGNENARVERDWLAKNLIDVETPQTPSPTGTARVWRQSWKSQGSDASIAERATYVGYPISDLVTARLEGIPHITDAFLTECARSVRHFMWLEGVRSSDQAAAITRPDIVGGVNRAGITAHTNGKQQTQGQALYANYLAILPWETTGYLDSEANRLHGYSWSGGWDKPKTLAAVAGRLVKAVL